MALTDLVGRQHDVTWRPNGRHLIPDVFLGVCDSKRRLKFWLRNSISRIFFFICPFWSAHFNFVKVVWTLSQCFQQFNYRNFIKGAIFLFTRIHNISHDSFPLKDGGGKLTVIYFSIYVFIYGLVRLLLVVILFSTFVCHSCSPLKGFGSAPLLTGTLAFGPPKKTKKLTSHGIIERKKTIRNINSASRISHLVWPTVDPAVVRDS